MEIKVGEYVRTEDGYIGIFDRYSKRPNTSIYKCPFNCFIKLRKRKTPLQCGREYIVNHNFNIKELIENKDILKVKTKESEILIIGFDENTIDIKYKEIIEKIENGEYELLEILTHEQYERNCYRLENNEC